ncbi:MAG TPA: ATP-binding protein [Acidimicrobiales bacterium]|nr:ATP-binding protein [Acidimicrobiales bacterium]
MSAVSPSPQRGRYTDHSSSRRFTPQPEQIAVARAFVRGLLDMWGLPAQRDEMEMATSELVTNAIVHGGGWVDVTISLSGDRLRLEVADGATPGTPLRSHDTRPDAVEGWGLRLVEELSDVWGARHEIDRTRVWMERRVQGRMHGTDPDAG